MKGNYESLMELAREVERVENLKEDYIVPFRSVQMLDDDYMAVGEKSFKLNPLAHGQLAGKVGIPKAYYDKMVEVPGLRAFNVNQWAKKDGEDRKFMVRTLEHDARAVLSDRYRPLDNSHVLAGVLRTLRGRDLVVKSSALSDRRMYLQVVFPRMEGEVKVGDPVQYGLTISNSEVGSGSVDISTFIYRLICKNGMVGNSVLNTRHVGRQIEGAEDYSFYSDDTVQSDIQTFSLKLRDTVEQALSETHFQNLLLTMQGATKDLIQKPMEAIRNITKRFDLSEEFGDLILGNMVEEGNLSRWGVVNGITAMVHQTENIDRQYELEKLGHDVLVLPRSEWEVLVA